MFPAQIGVIDLDPPVQLPIRLALGHDLHELVLDPPRGGIAHPQQAPQFQGRDVVLGLGQEVHGLEPNRQRQFAGVKDRASGQAGLPVAGLALPTRSAGHAIGIGMGRAAVRTDKARRPARLGQRRLALGFRTVGLMHLVQAQARLKLYPVRAHNHLQAGDGYDYPPYQAHGMSLPDHSC
jgi:hypothetical protein